MVLMALAVDSVADGTEGPPATEAKEEPGFTTRRRKRRRGVGGGKEKKQAPLGAVSGALGLARDQATPAKKR